MSKMREIDGYITLETSLVLPMVLFSTLLFMGYLCYFMNCGIIQGTMESVTLKGADAFHGGDYDTGEIDYRKMNRRNLYTEMFPGREESQEKVKKELKKELSSHLFLGKISKIDVQSKTTAITADTKMSFQVPGAEMLRGFGIQIFEYRGTYTASYISETEKIRGWSVVKRTVD